MRVRGPERSSILLLGRSTVIIGAIVITLLSFGLGYFWGYKGSDVADTEKETASSAESRVNIPPEDKRVLEPAPKDSSIAPSIKPPEFPHEVKPQKPDEPEKEPPKEQKSVEAQIDKNKIDKKSIEVAEEKTGQADIKQPVDKISSEPKVSEEKRSKTPKTAKKKASKSYGKAANSESAVSSKKAYTIQFGAFPNKEGAEQLQQSLRAKGIKAYIVSRSDSDPYFRVRAGTFKSKREADFAAVSLQKKTGMQNFVTIK